MKKLIILMTALAVATPAMAQRVRTYDARGRYDGYSERSTTIPNRIKHYDARGRLRGTTVLPTSRTRQYEPTRDYDSSGRYIGRSYDRPAGYYAR